jgi:hypothetical protein
MLRPKGRAYETIPKIAEHFDYVKAELPTVQVEKIETGEIDDLFGKESGDSVAPKLQFAMTYENAAKVRDVAEGVVLEREMIKRDTKKQNFVYEQTRKATTFLKEAFNGINDGTNRDGVAEQLVEAEDYLKRLQAWANTKP